MSAINPLYLPMRTLHKLQAHDPCQTCCSHQQIHRGHVPCVVYCVSHPDDSRLRLRRSAATGDGCHTYLGCGSDHLYLDTVRVNVSVLCCRLHRHSIDDHRLGCGGSRSDGRLGGRRSLGYGSGSGLYDSSLCRHGDTCGVVTRNGASTLTQASASDGRQSGLTMLA